MAHATRRVAVRMRDGLALPPASSHPNRSVGRGPPPAWIELPPPRPRDETVGDGADDGQAEPAAASCVGGVRRSSDIISEPPEVWTDHQDTVFLVDGVGWFMAPNSSQILPFDKEARATAQIDCCMSSVWTQTEGTHQILGIYDALWDTLEVRHALVARLTAAARRLYSLSRAGQARRQTARLRVRCWSERRADRCSGCQGAKYCSRACQSQAWAQHRILCRPAQLVERAWDAFIGPVVEIISRMAAQYPWDARRTLVFHWVPNAEAAEDAPALQRLRLCCATLWPLEWGLGAIARCIRDETGEYRTMLQAPVPKRHLRVVVQAGGSGNGTDFDIGHRARVFLVAAPPGRAVHRSTQIMDWEDVFTREGLVAAGAKMVI